MPSLFGELVERRKASWPLCTPSTVHGEFFSFDHRHFASARTTKLITLKNHTLTHSLQKLAIADDAPFHRESETFIGCNFLHLHVFSLNFAPWEIAGRDGGLPWEVTANNEIINSIEFYHCFHINTIVLIKKIKDSP